MPGLKFVVYREILLCLSGSYYVLSVAWDLSRNGMQASDVHNRKYGTLHLLQIKSNSSLLLGGIGFTALHFCHKVFQKPITAEMLPLCCTDPVGVFAPTRTCEHFVCLCGCSLTTSSPVQAVRK